jgi:Holliday junction resolvase
VNSREKGKRGERLWRDFLNANGFDHARRGQQFAGGQDSPDVICPGMEAWHPEVKFTQKFTVYTFMAQAVRDAKGKIPYVAMKSANKPWLVTLRAEDFLALVKNQK